MAESWQEYVGRISTGPSSCVPDWVARQALRLMERLGEVLQVKMPQPAAYVLEDECLFCSWDTADWHVEVEINFPDEVSTGVLEWFGRSWKTDDYWHADRPDAETIPERAIDALREMLKGGTLV